MSAVASIIIPSYNSARYLTETLKSAFAQTYTHLEVIVVNDGSTDETESILQGFSDPRLKIIHQSNHGSNHAKNQGIAKATGEYFVFLDADDVLHPRKVESQMAVAQSVDPSVLISGNWKRFRDSTLSATDSENPLFTDFDDPIEFVCTAWESNSMIQPAAWFVHRSLIEKAGRWSEGIISDDDGDFFVRVACHSKKIIYCPESIVYYRTSHHGSQSAQSSFRHMQARYQAAILQTECLLGFETSERTKKAVATRWKYRAFELMLYSVPLGNKAYQRSLEYGGSNAVLQETKSVRVLKRVLGLSYARRLQGLRAQLEKWLSA